jgi:anti-sigma regulatory factor (Ser/Thr protein kinase)
MEAAPAGSLGPTSDPLAHQAIIYRTVGELIGAAAPVLHAGVRAGERVVAIVDTSVADGLRDWLGPAAAAVEFTSPDEAMSLPAQNMVAATRRQVQALIGAGASAVTMVGQHQPWMPNSDLAWWDAAFNVVLAELPVTLVCACPAAAQQASRVIRQTHPWVRTDRGVAPNPAYRDAASVLADHPPGAPPALGPCNVSLSFSSNEDLVELREHTSRHGRATGLPAGRVGDLVLAVTELAANSIEHGAGHGTVQIWTEPGGLTVDVRDPGRMSHLLPGLRLPSTASLRGRGLWLGRELCEAMHVWHTEAGTGVRVRIGCGAGSTGGTPAAGPPAG